MLCCAWLVRYHCSSTSVSSADQSPASNQGHFSGARGNRLPEGQHSYTSYQGRQHLQASNADHAHVTPTSNASVGTSSGVSPNMSVGAVSNSTPRYNAVPTSNPSYQYHHTSAGHHQLPLTSAGLPAGTLPSSLQLQYPASSSFSSTLHSPTYINSGNGGTSGPSSLPGSTLPPLPPPGNHHHKDLPLQANQSHLPQSGWNQDGSANIMGEVDIVEKDSPPSSFSYSQGPSSLNVQSSLPSSSQKLSSHVRYSHQLPPSSLHGGGTNIDRRGAGLSQRPELNTAGLGRGMGRNQPQSHHRHPGFSQSGNSMVAQRFKSSTDRSHGEGT